MKDFNTDLFDPRAAIDSDYVLAASTSSPDSDFGFAFDDSNFSDRLLRIEIVGGSDETEPDFAGRSSVLDWARRKRRKEERKTENCEFYSTVFFLLFVSQNHSFLLLSTFRRVRFFCWISVASFISDSGLRRT